MNGSKTLCILLVDDHDDSLRAMSRLLTRSGYTVHTANSIEAARLLASEKQCDLLISDVSLGDGSGLDLMRELGGANGIAGIAISGHSHPEDMATARAAGFREYLVKPVAFNDLLSVVHDFAQAS